MLSNIKPARERRFTAMVLAVAALCLAPTLTYRMGLDQGIYAYMAAELLEGRWPYIATWDHQPPGGMLLHAIEILLFGKSIAMFRAADLLYQLGNVYLIYRITRRLTDRAGGYVAAVTYTLIYQGYGPWNTAQREGFALLWILLAFWLYLTADRRREAWTALGIGSCLGVAVTIKPTLLAFSAMYLPLFLQQGSFVTDASHPRPSTSSGRANPAARGEPVEPRARGQKAGSNHSMSVRGRIGFALVAAVGFLLPMLPIVIFYWTQGALLSLYEAAIAYNRDVYAQRLRGDAPLLAYWLGKLARLGGHAVALAVLYPPFLLGGPARRQRLVLFLGYLCSLVAVFVQGTFAGYHYLPGLGIGSILVGSMFSRTMAQSALPFGRFRASASIVAANAVLVVGLLVNVDSTRVRDLVTLTFLERPRPGEFRNGSVFDFTESYEAAEYLKAHTSSADRIQVWGHESLVYYLADRDAASRFQTSNALVVRPPGRDLAPMQQAWRRELVHDLIRQAPAYFVVVRGDNWWWAPDERTSEQLLDDFVPLKQLVQSHYSLERSIGKFLIYRRVSVPRDA